MEFKYFWLEILDIFQEPVNKMTVIMKLAAMGPIGSGHGYVYLVARVRQGYICFEPRSSIINYNKSHTAFIVSSDASDTSCVHICSKAADHSLIQL
jgi:hypothetical protein